MRIIFKFEVLIAYLCSNRNYSVEKYILMTEIKNNIQTGAKALCGGEEDGPRTQAEELWLAE